MFGERLQQLRQENKETQIELADFLGMSRQTIANYEIEKHEPDYETLDKIATRYNVSVDYLLGRTGIKNNYINYPQNISKLIENIYSLAQERSDTKKIDYLKAILVELNKLL